MYISAYQEKEKKLYICICWRLTIEYLTLLMATNFNLLNTAPQTHPHPITLCQQNSNLW